MKDRRTAGVGPVDPRVLAKSKYRLIYASREILILRTEQYVDRLDVETPFDSASPRNARYVLYGTGVCVCLCIICFVYIFCCNPAVSILSEYATRFDLPRGDQWYLVPIYENIWSDATKGTPILCYYSHWSFWYNHDDTTTVLPRVLVRPSWRVSLSQSPTALELFCDGEADRRGNLETAGSGVNARRQLIFYASWQKNVQFNVLFLLQNDTPTYYSRINSTEGSFSSWCFRWSRCPSFNRPSICRRPESHTHMSLFLFLEVSLFPCIFCIISAFFLYGEYVVRFLLPNGVFLPCDHGLDFLHQLIWEFNQSINNSVVWKQITRKRQKKAPTFLNGCIRISARDICSSLV